MNGETMSRRRAIFPPKSESKTSSAPPVPKMESVSIPIAKPVVSSKPPRPTSGIISIGTEPERNSEHGEKLLLKWFNEYYDFIWRTLRRFGVRDEYVDDAAQHVFIIVSRRYKVVRPGCEKAFLFATAIRVASDFKKVYLRRRITDVALENIADPKPLQDELMDLKSMRHMLDSILDNMDFDIRTVFVLFELEGMTISEIAEMLSIPTGTAASRLRRAREQFRNQKAQLLSKYERSSSIPKKR